MASNIFVQVVLTRDASQNVYGYVNGVQEFSFVDYFGLAVLDPSVPLIFFRDAGVNPISTNPASAGSVARLASL